MANEFSFARIFVEFALFSPGDYKVHCPIIVVVAADCGDARSRARKTGGLCNVSKCPVAVVSEHRVRLMELIEGQHDRLARLRSRLVQETGDVKVNIAVVVVVDKCQTKIETVGPDAGRFRHILECAVFFVVQQENSSAETYGEIGGAVVVIISCGAADAVQGGIKS